MATIGSQGLVDDGGSGLSVAGNAVFGGVTTTNANAMSPNTAAGSGSLVLIAQPGFYQVPVSGVSGQGVFTGSMPSASAFPGGEILITDTVGIWPYMLTGSMAMMTGSVGSTASSLNGTKLKVSAGGTVGFWSDSKGWLVCAVSGTVTLSP